MPKKPKPDPAVTRAYSPEVCFVAMNCTYCIQNKGLCDVQMDALRQVRDSGALHQCPQYKPKARPAGASAAYPIRREVT